LTFSLHCCNIYLPMKTKLAHEKRREFFQFELDPLTKKKLTELAKSNGISASGYLRMFINSEHSRCFNGNGHTPTRESEAASAGLSLEPATVQEGE
jgi:hypothetical protein